MKTFLQHKVVTAPLAAIISFSSLIPFTPADARITFKAPAVGVPGRRVAGASRMSDQCLLNNQRLTAIVPQSNIGFTTVANPVLLFYVPQTSAQAELELVVLDGKNKNNIVAKQSYKSSGKAGIVNIPLNTASLQVGQQYRWSFSIICDSKARSRDHVVEGAIERIQPAPQLTTQLKSAKPQELPNLYAEAGIWQDSVATLARLRSSRPNDAELKADWEALLTTQGEELANVVNAPLLQNQEAPQLKRNKRL